MINVSWFNAIAFFQLSLSLSLFASSDVKVYKENNTQSFIPSTLSSLKFGNNKYNGESIRKLIGYINENRSNILIKNEPNSKLYFNPVIEGKDGENSVYLGTSEKKGYTSGAIRLQQAFYFYKKNSNTRKQIYVPFEGADITAYINGLKTQNNKIVTNGKLESLNSSLVSTTKYNHLINGMNEININSLYSSSLRDRISVYNSLKEAGFFDDSGDEDLHKKLKHYFGFESSSPKEIALKFISDKGILKKIITQNKRKLVMVKATKGSDYEIAWKIDTLFNAPLVMYLSADKEKKNKVIKSFSLIDHLKVKIYTGTEQNLKKRLRKEGDSSIWAFKDKGRRRIKLYEEALRNLSKVAEGFKSSYNWNGYDNKGSALEATVKVKIEGLKENAGWAGSPYNQFVFGKGGSQLGNFISAFDVVGHEYSHAIVSRTAKLDKSGEPGALNEHISDILGVGFESDLTGREFDYKIGETVFMNKSEATSLRDFLNPEKSFTKQATSVKDMKAKGFGKYCSSSSYNDNCGVHFSNGVVNKVVAKSIEKYGWSSIQTILFDVLTKRLRSSSDFLDYRTQFLASCENVLKEGECKEVAKLFDSVGIVDNGGSEVSDSSVESEFDMCSVYTEPICKILADTPGEYREGCAKCGF